MILLVGVLWGIGLVTASGGDLKRLGRVSLRFERLVLGLFVVQGIARVLPYSMATRSVAMLVWALSGVGLFLLLIGQDSRAMGLVAIGLGLNLLVVLANEGMPVAAPSATLPMAALNGAFYHQVSPADMLTVLADVLPFPGGWMLSLGDLLVVTGVLSYLASLCIGAAGSRRATPGVA